ncbi:MAG: hypothetical protein LBP51_04380 [Deferribacteraceae bacterium]|jgi:hypothetical protein|nr:hypothetical protein [Deferribacteraceae bacterium]
MNTAKQELNTVIDTHGYDDDDDTILTAEEAAEIDRIEAECDADPSNSIPFEEVLAKHRAQGLDV